MEDRYRITEDVERVCVRVGGGSERGWKGTETERQKWK